MFLRYVRTGAILLVTVFSTQVTALGDDLRDAMGLMATGENKNLQQALTLLDRRIAADAVDFRPRYLKSVILMDLGRHQEAVDYLELVIRDHPRVAELYNNRGIARHAMKQYSKAMQDFEEAIRLKPDYALAHENLASLHVSLAEIAAGQAHKLDPSNTQLKELHTRLVAISPQESSAAVPAALDKSAQPLLPTPPTPASPASPASPETSVKPPPKAVAKPAAVIPDSHWGDVIRFIKAWQATQENKNVEGYLAAYSPAFKPTSARTTRKEWETTRAQELIRQPAIKLVMRDLDIAFPDANTAEVHFEQTLRSGQSERTESKILLLTNDHGRWLIEEERTLSK